LPCLNQITDVRGEELVAGLEVDDEIDRLWVAVPVTEVAKAYLADWYSHGGGEIVGVRR